MKKLILIFLFIGLFLISSYSISLVIITYRYIFTLRYIDNPEQFAKNFKPEGEPKVKLKYKCDWYKDFLCKNSYPVSTFLPHVRLVTSHHISYLPYLSKVYSSTRSIRIDKFWKVFWVDIDRIGTFGPYRSSFDYPKFEKLNVNLQIKESDKYEVFKPPRIELKGETIRVGPHTRDTFVRSVLRTTAYQNKNTITIYEDEVFNVSDSEYSESRKNEIIETIDVNHLPKDTYELIMEKRDVFKSGLIISTVVFRDKIQL